MLRGEHKLLCDVIPLEQSVNISGANVAITSFLAPPFRRGKLSADM